MKTCSIIDPPVRNGGMAASSSRSAVEHADAGGSEHLVPGERQEVDVQRGHVDGLVRYRLAGVEHGQRADPPGGGDQHLDRVDRAQHVGLVGEGHHFRPGRDQRIERRQIEPESVGDAEPTQGRPGSAAQFLPRNEIRVVLHLRDDDLVTRAEDEPPRGRVIREGRVPERIGHQVQRLGGVLGEHDLVRRRRPDEGSDARAGRLEVVGRLLGQRMRSTLDRGVVVGDEVLLGVDHRHRALRGRAGIQVHQTLPVPDRAVQDREVVADGGHVEDVTVPLVWTRHHRVAHADAPAPVKRT